MMEMYKAFYALTSSDLFIGKICAVCGRKQLLSEMKVEIIPLEDIPNKNRIRPAHIHQDMDLIDGMLLERNGLQGENNAEVCICEQCMRGLRAGKNECPKFSLANNLWVGDIPIEIEQMTLPE